MFLKNYKKTGKILAYVGIWIFAFGFAFNGTIGITDPPDFLATLSIPLIVIGIIMLIGSNFYKRKRRR